ncbi:MAG: bifunctional metallophosphatase/5'-nucleotidase [Deltaproteobacteria bacterium]|nr:bifunctional metallophosphatase/5'-nucleotidase [Deltaproteobacteria bacterium]
MTTRIVCFFFAVSLSLLISVCDAREISLRILYFNDFHGFAEPYKPLGSEEKVGGITYFAAKLNKLRREKPSVFLAAGDMIQGDNWANLFQGRSVIELLNVMRLDAMVLGNHEFDFGQAVLRRRLREARFPVLGANVQGLKGIKPYVIKKVQGVRVAIVGIATPDTAVSTHPRNVAGLKFLSPEDTVKKYLPSLKRRADLVILLTHLGYPVDRALAEKAPGADVIVGGHTHTKLVKPTVIGRTVIVQAWEHAKALGVLDLELKDGKVVKAEGRLEEIKPVAGQEDPKTLHIVKKYQSRVDAILNVKIGVALVDLDADQVRVRETRLGNLVADIIRQRAGAQAAIINGGGIRTSINQGDIIRKQVYAALPFDNYIVAIRLTGRQIRDTLEHGVSGLEELAGRFPQVSGLTFTYDPTAPPGSRVREVTVGGQPLEPEREYTVATNDFLAAGGDGFTAFGEAIRADRTFEVAGGMLKSARLVFSDAGTWIRDVVIDYISARKQVGAELEGRIKAVK